MDLDLTDRVFLVTGGTSGLGRATATALVGEGARVVVSGRTQQRVDAAVGELSSADGGEAIGVARAAAAHGMPCAISFTVETDGRLVGGRGLRQAIEATDEATGGSPAYYMINCAHPTHFSPVLERGGDWTRRIAGLRANASRMSHAELDDIETLDAGDPADLGQRYRELLQEMPEIRIIGGCCGTDHRHVAAIASACGGSAIAPPV